MAWAKCFLCALACAYPAFWLGNTISPLFYGAGRIAAGKVNFSQIFFSPFGIFFAGLRMPWRLHLGASAAAVLLVLLVFFWRRQRYTQWRTAVAGAAASLFLYGSTHYASAARAERQRAQTASLLASLPKTPAGQPYAGLFFQRGVSFTAEGGVHYGSEEAIHHLKQLPAYGVNSIALVPYGGGRVVDGAIRIRVAGRGSWESDAGLEIITAAAHQLGMKVMLKPHLWRFGPEVTTSDELRRQWFAEYTNFISHYAKLAERIHADIFVVGTEFGALSSYEREWRAVVAAVRALYQGPLTFAPTQGPEFETLAFWDALDYIGLDNYYPLPDSYSTAELMAKVEAVQKRFNKPVVFTEAGFSAIVNAHRAPWEDETEKPLSLEEQARCYEALLSAFYAKPWFHGVYWWKVGTNGYGGPDNNSMTPWGKPAMEVVKRWYTSAKR